MDSDKAAMVENSDDDIEEVEEEEEGSETLSKEKLQAAVLQNPKVMAALQARLDSMVGDPSGYIKVTNLPESILNSITQSCPSTEFASSCSKTDQGPKESPVGDNKD